MGLNPNYILKRAHLGLSLRVHSVCVVCMQKLQLELKKKKKKRWLGIGRRVKTLCQFLSRWALTDIRLTERMNWLCVHTSLYIDWVSEHFHLFHTLASSNLHLFASVSHSLFLQGMKLFPSSAAVLSPHYSDTFSSTCQLSQARCCLSGWVGGHR